MVCSGAAPENVVRQWMRYAAVGQFLSLPTADQIMLVGVCRGRSAGVQIEFGEDVAQMASDGFLAYVELAANSSVGHTRSDEPENFDFTPGKRASAIAPLLRQENIRTRKLDHGAQPLKCFARGRQFLACVVFIP